MEVIHSNRTVLPGSVQEAFVTIEQGKIIRIDTTLPTGNEYLLTDVQDHLLIPGVIDPHVHINEPGRSEWEGFDTATGAAVAGGVTTLVDMPLNSSPVTTTPEALDEKIAVAKNKIHANVGFWGGIVPGNQNQAVALIGKGILGFKAFLTHSGIDEFPNVTEEDLCKVMPVIARYGLPLLVHCELTDTRTRQLGNERSYPNYLASRPEKWETDAVALMIKLCEKFNCRVHIVHLSSGGSIEQIKKAKEKGLPLTVETAQHYLFFTSDMIKDGQTQFKCAPPIREPEHTDALWKALQTGIIDFVATDHSPATPDLKQMGSGDFTKAWGGIASLQFALPVLWTAARKKGIVFADLVKWLCENPAKLIGLQDRKGKIEVGFDADLVVINDKEKFVVNEDMIHHKHKVTPYLNEQLFGVVKQTYIAGKKVFDNGQFIRLNGGSILLH